MSATIAPDHLMFRDSITCDEMRDKRRTNILIRLDRANREWGFLNFLRQYQPRINGAQIVDNQDRIDDANRRLRFWQTRLYLIDNPHVRFAIRGKGDEASVVFESDDDRIHFMLSTPAVKG